MASLQPCESPFDPMSCELISGELVNEQAYGDVAFGNALESKHLTLNTRAEIFSESCEFSG